MISYLRVHKGLGGRNNFALQIWQIVKSILLLYTLIVECLLLIVVHEFFMIAQQIA